MGTDATGRQTRAPGRAATAIRNLDPGSFAFVMAAAIISTGAFLLGPSWLSRALLPAASTGLLVLSAALVIRLAFFSFVGDGRPSGPGPGVRLLRDLGRDRRARTAARLEAAGHPLNAAILAGLAAVVWLLLTYGVPASLLLMRERESVLGGILFRLVGVWHLVDPAADRVAA